MTTGISDPVTTIRPMASLSEYRQCERLQAAVWGSDDIAGIPLLALQTAQENGGIVLGAFGRDGEMMGFVYSFVGIVDRLVRQCSVLLAVDPKYQGIGLGRQLKLAQRRAALDLGIRLITWTFDPLLRVNANLNIRRLGGIAGEYKVNQYGTGRGLNGGLETDRLVVEWWLDGHRDDRIGVVRDTACQVNEIVVDARTGLPYNMNLDLSANDEVILLGIPGDFAGMKTAHPVLARQWRMDTRELFSTYLSRGYVVIDVLPAGGDHPTPCYVLRRRWTR